MAHITWELHGCECGYFGPMLEFTEPKTKQWKHKCIECGGERKAEMEPAFEPELQVCAT